MLESRLLARRVGPLDTAARAVSPSSGVEVRALGPATRLSLRIRLGEAQPELAGLDLAINRMVGTGERWCARLGPDEWLTGGPEADNELIQGEIEQALEGCFHSLVDVSHRNVGFEISGATAAQALNAGCPLDLHDAAFPAGSATRTLLGKVEIVLLRPSDAPVYRVDCWRSFAAYVHGFLVEAADSTVAV
ncbi:MAG TPA: sarcosine oxidase subunit gamma family protein [Hansschlegelia sp.]